jgi:hypothetical protein
VLMSCLSWFLQPATPITLVPPSNISLSLFICCSVMLSVFL